jgi:hypothetical protein
MASPANAGRFYPDSRRGWAGSRDRPAGLSQFPSLSSPVSLPSIRPGRGWCLLVPALVVLLIAGCVGSFAYHRLDWLIPWYVDDYVDLSREQRESLRDQLLPLLQWHREEELARYQLLLDEVEKAMQQQVTAAQVEGWIAELMQAISRVEETMLDLALEFGAGISDAQMQEFISSMHKEQDEYEDEFLSRTQAEYVHENAENLEGMLERLTGHLGHGQKQRLQQAAQSMQRFDAVWLEERQQWLAQLEVLLQREEGWQSEVRQGYLARELNRPAQYTEIVDHNIRVIAAALADVLNSRSDKQKKHTAHEFVDMRKSLNRMRGL